MRARADRRLRTPVMPPAHHRTAEAIELDLRGGGGQFDVSQQELSNRMILRSKGQLSIEYICANLIVKVGRLGQRGVNRCLSAEKREADLKLQRHGRIRLKVQIIRDPDKIRALLAKAIRHA